jgi:hypothetical protein
MSVFKNNHANQRFFERVDPDDASKRDIIKALQHPSNVQYIKKLTASRTMAYIHLPNESIVKAIINKNKMELVTILPWKDIYKHVVDMGEYIVHLYPDCYAETNNESTLNRVLKLNEVSGTHKDIPFNAIDFSEAIQNAWDIHINSEEAEVI